MAIGRIYVNSHVANIQIKPSFHSRGQLRSGVNHNRRVGKEAQKANIDKRLEFLNESVLDMDAAEIFLTLANRLSGKEYTLDNVPAKEELHYENGGKVRADAVIAYEIETSYPGDMIWSRLTEDGRVVPVEEDTVIDESNINLFFKMPLNMDEFIEWKLQTIDFLKGHFGEENILSIQVHMDEDEPHIHAIGLPIYKDKEGNERLSYRQISGGPKGLASLQTAYADSVSHLGYKRGEEFSSRLSDMSTKEYKAKLNSALREEMPETIKECHDEISRLRVKNFSLTTEIHRTYKSAKAIQNLRIRNNELSEAAERLKAENEKLKNQNEELARQNQIFRNRQTAEEIGRKIFERRFPGNDALEQLDNAFKEIVSLGVNQMEKETGRTVILSYLDDLNHDGINDSFQTIDSNHDGADDRTEHDFK